MEGPAPSCSCKADRCGRWSHNLSKNKKSMMKFMIPTIVKKSKTRCSSTPMHHSRENSRSWSDDDVQQDPIEDSSRSVECDLLKIYDACNTLPAERRLKSPVEKKEEKITRVNAFPCSDASSVVPPSPPTKWPQRPILLRPSPESDMKIIGVRHSSSKEYLPLPGSGYCEGCTLPINNGYENPGECLVVDFESELFIGTLLLRVKGIPPAFPDLEDSEDSETSAEDKSGNNKEYYFNKKKRTFQATVKGRFKQPGIPMSECITGQMFNRPAGYLPPRLVVKGAVSIISRLAPQLQARLDGDCPRFLSPLVCTAQTVLVNSLSNDPSADEKEKTYSCADESIEQNIHEPKASDQYSTIQFIIKSGAGDLIGMSSTPQDKSSLSSRIKTRKKAFDKIFSEGLKTPTFDTDKEYTFEFFQHLITFDDFCLDFARPLGKHPLSDILNGQPLKFMAAHQTKEAGELSEEDEVFKWLWCFDLWHESLYENALMSVNEGGNDA